MTFSCIKQIRILHGGVFQAANTGTSGKSQKNGNALCEVCNKPANFLCRFLSLCLISFQHSICNCTLFLSGCELVYYCTTTCQVFKMKRSCSPLFNLAISQGSATLCHLFRLQFSTKTKNNITFSSICYLIKSH